jgi:hypothetical protein
MMLAYGCIKMSIVAFYRRLFVTNKTSIFGIVTLVTQVGLFLWSLAFILLIIFPCGTHVWANWGSSGDQLALCPVVFTSEYGLTGSDLILDLYIFLLPLPSVRFASLLVALADPAGLETAYDVPAQADGKRHSAARSDVGHACSLHHAS